MLSNQTRAIVKSTAPVLAEHGLAITEHFYKRMFEQEPTLRNIFNQAHQAAGDQPRALANAVYAYAANIDRLEVLSAAVQRITNKHASLNITPDQYDIVGYHLLASIKTVLGEAASDEIMNAWKEAYAALAGLLIDAEAALYRSAEEKAGGWTGWRKFRVQEKVAESSEITSFYLYPADGGRVPAFNPGQYISVRVFVPSLGLTQPRQYSLSDAPNERYFRISVKKEGAKPDVPEGLVSNLLHEQFDVGSEIEVSPPFGDFMLHDDRTTPAVLISGGVGITPMLSMLNTLIAGEAARDVVFVHGARDSEVRAMKGFIQHATHDSGRVKPIIFLESVSDKDQPGEDYDQEGRVDLERIRDQILLPEADYYLCGPIPFIKAHRGSLVNMGVDQQRIHYEIFGSHVLEE